MIYAIIGKTENSEWVHSTWDDVESATEAVERVRVLIPQASFFIRPVDYAHTLVERVVDKALRPSTEAKEELNRQWAKHKMDHEEGYPDTDSIREPKHSSDFTLDELFGNQTGKMVEGQRLVACRECGAMVVFSNRHVNWHNKLLP